MTKFLGSPTLLDDLTVVSVSGSDAEGFLQSQLTQDIGKINSNTSSLAAYCSPKGRVIATMVVCADNQMDESFLLITKSDNAMALVQRLKMFILRSKVNIEVLNRSVFGVYSDNGANPFEVVSTPNSITISAPNYGTGQPYRFWQIKDNTETENTTLSNPEQWYVDDIKAGLVWVNADTTELFIPQTLNFDLINAVSFTKGCYPGQEIVARSHYRGVIKRRAALAIADSNELALLENTTDKVVDTYNAHKPNNPCGRIINSAISADKLYVLMETNIADLDNADFRLASPDGPKLQIQDLPYSII